MEAVSFSALEVLTIQLLLYLPSKIVLVVTGLRLFDLYSRAGYCAVAALCFLLHFVFAMNRPYLASLVVLLFAVAAPLLLFSRDGLPRRAFTVLVIMVAVVFAQIFPSLIWDSLTSASPYDPGSVTTHLGYSVFVRAVQLCVLSLLLAGVVWAESRIARNRSDRGVFSFIWFLIMQFILAGLIVFLIELTGTSRDQVVVGIGVIVMLFVGVDALYFFLLDRYNRSLAEAHRAEVLRQELDRYLKSYEAIERELAETAHLRHDMRNQLNIILALVDQGDVVQARRYLGSLIGRVAGFEEGEAFLGGGAGSAVACAYRESSEGSAAKTCAPLPPNGALSDEQPSLAVPADGSGTPAFSTGLGDSCMVELRSKTCGGGVFMRRSNPLGITHWFLELLFPVSQMLPLLLLLVVTRGSSHYEVIVFACAAAVLLCFAADVALFKAFAVVRRKELVTERIRLLDEQKDLRKQHYDRLAGELEKVKGMRSAMAARLCELDGKLASGALDEASAQFREAAGLFGPLDERFCDNKAANALIAMKARTCRESGIAFESNISLSDGLPVPDIDLCIALSNLLDNAVSGCEKLESAERRIALKGCASSGILVIEVTNSCLAGTPERVALALRDGLSSRLLTRPLSRGKPESLRSEDSLLREHGWGLLILGDLARRYGGSFEVDDEGGLFRATVVLPLVDAFGA